jgi:catabolite regulation protein CreA
LGLAGDQNKQKGDKEWFHNRLELIEKKNKIERYKKSTFTF